MTAHSLLRAPTGNGAYDQGMPAATTARQIAAEIRRRDPGVGTKKLHKLLYYCHGHHLATFDATLFADPIMAWDMGPVVAHLWYDERVNGPEAPATSPVLDEAALNTIGFVLSRYGQLTGADLQRLTHAEEPWQFADHDRLPGTSARIQREWIRDFFRAAGSEDDDSDVPALDSAEVTEWLRGAPDRLKAPATVTTREQLVERLARRA